jgi:hypothetical protein
MQVLWAENNNKGIIIFALKEMSEKKRRDF